MSESTKWVLVAVQLTLLAVQLVCLVVGVWQVTKQERAFSLALFAAVGLMVPVMGLGAVVTSS